MLKSKGLAKLMLLVGGLLVLALMAAACGGAEKQVIKFHDGQWETLWEHNAIAMYITENGYGYPVEEVTGTTGTMKVALPQGDLDVNMELWQANVADWYQETVGAGTVVDLAGQFGNVENGATGQILETSMQGIYVPSYMVEQNPGLKSVMDLPKFKELIKDPEDASKGVVVNCIIGWNCQKIIRAKWHAYGLYDDINLLEPGAAAAIDANIAGAYQAGEPVASYYWEPTKLIADLDMTLLEEPPWTAECQAAIDAAIEAEPYESTMGCAFKATDVHAGVYSGLVERAPEVTDFLGKMFIGSLALGDLAAWKNDNNKEWSEAAVYWLKNNEATWMTWVTDDAAKKVKESLAKES
ncbi:MAG: hypothetical protein BZY88_19090 [SAR202 cluster bacterium Io17-Chloro-G9]|nr:MAG: hypothetical protein BZY88_19090 [SAR202 cluster bacterium Io17-Chloro-G9]